MENGPIEVAHYSGKSSHSMETYLQESEIGCPPEPT
jgi:hypothetical protein